MNAAMMALLQPSKGKVLGFLGFGSVKVTKIWRDDPLNLLKILANIAADALVKVEAEKEINCMAYNDQLTGLPNHTLFTDRLTQSIHLAKRSETLIVVVFLDPDSFKRNHRHGGLDPLEASGFRDDFAGGL